MYGATAVSYLYLWKRFPNLKRPWKSRLGPAAAVFIIIVSLCLLIVMSYQHWLAICICAVKLIVGMTFFFVMAWNTDLVLSEEEKYIQKHINPHDDDQEHLATEVVAETVKIGPVKARSEVVGSALMGQTEPLLVEEV
ncbi:hypothetical protein HK101_010441 [Irineochytrium annulatum]|nr:hypothetical protein HK101_010441 [Irineochytrium annulatum]